MVIAQPGASGKDLPANLRQKPTSVVALPRQCRYIASTSNPFTYYMHVLKTQTMSLRVSPKFKLALRTAAEREHRSQANFLEHLLFAYCDANGITIPAGRATAKNQK